MRLKYILILAFLSPQLKAESTIGLMLQNSPRYEGSQKSFTQILPLIQLQYKDIFFDTTKGLGYHLTAKNGTYFEQTLGYNAGRATHNSSWRAGSDDLKGLGEIKQSLNTSLALGWQVKPWLIPEIKTTVPLTQNQGTQFQIGLTLVPFYTPTNTIILETDVLGANKKYMNTYYGINSIQKQRSRYSKYTLQSNFLGTQVNVSWLHQFSKHWSSMANISYLNLANEISKSPIVDKKANITSVVGLTYQF